MEWHHWVRVQLEEIAQSCIASMLLGEGEGFVTCWDGGVKYCPYASLHGAEGAGSHCCPICHGNHLYPWAEELFKLGPEWELKRRQGDNLVSNWPLHTPELCRRNTMCCQQRTSAADASGVCACVHACTYLRNTHTQILCLLRSLSWWLLCAQAETSPCHLSQSSWVAPENTTRPGGCLITWQYFS